MEEQQKGQNPFLSMIQGMEDVQDEPQGMTQPQAPQQAPAPQGMAGAGVEGAELPPEEAQLQRGQNGSGSEDLIKALSSIERFISNSTDKESIMLLRGVASALARLIGKSEEGLRII